MAETRRHWLVTLGSASLMLMADRLAYAQRSPQPLPSPNAPNPAYPPGLSGPEQTRDSKDKVVDPARAQELRTDVEKLYQLASELRDELSKADPRATLSVTFLKKAQDAEKVAKQIKNLAKA